MANTVHTVVDAAKEFYASRYPIDQLAHFGHRFGKTIFHLGPSGQAIRCGKPCSKIHDRTLLQCKMGLSIS
ncbi:MAG TPA: hypothetical protein IAC56_03105 [Candidatus Aphodousia faecigallinarum]|uniref:Uncharacterized protein n=1 Tax=Candidatus Aphodousia faecigallinarum TaxID=2840677 RepID=A0A9D1IHY6_9BURK|nr:hypothetical protein [Candidatus Aphodousia faecigallinarum]